MDTPKQSIWLAGLFLLSNIRINIDTLHYQRDLREHPVPDSIREMTQLIADITKCLGIGVQRGDSLGFSPRSLSKSSKGQPLAGFK